MVDGKVERLESTGSIIKDFEKIQRIDLNMNEKQDINYEIVSNTDFLHLRYDGEWSQDTAAEVIDKMVALVEEHQQSRVLVDVRGARYQGSMYSDYIVSEKIKNSPLNRVDKIAYLDQTSRKEIADNIEKIIRAFGLPIRFFISMDDAIVWLMHD